MDRYGAALDLPEMTFPQMERYLRDTTTGERPVDGGGGGAGGGGAKKWWKAATLEAIEGGHHHNHHHHHHRRRHGRDEDDENWCVCVSVRASVRVAQQGSITARVPVALTGCGIFWVPVRAVFLREESESEPRVCGQASGQWVNTGVLTRS